MRANAVAAASALLLVLYRTCSQCTARSPFAASQHLCLLHASPTRDKTDNKNKFWTLPDSNYRHFRWTNKARKIKVPRQIHRCLNRYHKFFLNNSQASIYCEIFERLTFRTLGSVNTSFSTHRFSLKLNVSTRKSSLLVDICIKHVKPKKERYEWC